MEAATSITIFHALKLTADWKSHILGANEKRRPEVDGKDGMKSKVIREAICESAYIGRAVRYEGVLSGKVEEYQKPINEHWGL